MLEAERDRSLSSAALRPRLLLPQNSLGCTPRHTLSRSSTGVHSPAHCNDAMHGAAVITLHGLRSRQTECSCQVEHRSEHGSLRGGRVHSKCIARSLFIMLKWEGERRVHSTMPRTRDRSCAVLGRVCSDSCDHYESHPQTRILHRLKPRNQLAYIRTCSAVAATWRTLPIALASALDDECQQFERKRSTRSCSTHRRGASTRRGMEGGSRTCIRDWSGDRIQPMGGTQCQRRDAPREHQFNSHSAKTIACSFLISLLCCSLSDCRKQHGR